MVREFVGINIQEKVGGRKISGGMGLIGMLREASIGQMGQKTFFMMFELFFLNHHYVIQMFYYFLTM